MPQVSDQAIFTPLYVVVPTDAHLMGFSTVRDGLTATFKLRDTAITIETIVDDARVKALGTEEVRELCLNNNNNVRSVLVQCGANSISVTRTVFDDKSIYTVDHSFSKASDKSLSVIVRDTDAHVTYFIHTDDCTVEVYYYKRKA